MINDSDSQMSLSLIFTEGRGASVHRLSEQDVLLQVPQVKTKANLM